MRRSRSCFVVGEISRVTVWFVSGTHISSVPAVVNATSGEGERKHAVCTTCRKIPFKVETTVYIKHSGTVIHLIDLNTIGL